MFIRILLFSLLFIPALISGPCVESADFIESTRVDALNIYMKFQQLDKDLESFRKDVKKVASICFEEEDMVFARVDVAHEDVIYAKAEFHRMLRNFESLKMIFFAELIVII